MKYKLINPGLLLRSFHIIQTKETTNHKFFLLLIILFAALRVEVQQAATFQLKDTAVYCHVALVQPQLVWDDVKANLSAFEKRVRQCWDCDLIVFPELFTSGCEMKKKDKEQATRSKDKIASYYPVVLKRMRKWAKQSGSLIIGSTIYKEEEKYYNRLLAVFPNGEYKYYDKHNCFKKGSFSPGNKQLIFTWRGHRFATYICYDLRFPEWSKNEGQYDTAIYIANWPASRREDWNKLLRERAIENQAHVIAVNCAGTDPTGIAYAGESCLIAPNGEIQAACEDYQEDIVITGLDWK